MTNPDHNAFASEYGHGCNKREYLAGLAMLGILSASDAAYPNPADAARFATEYADALISALNATTPK